MAVARHWPRRYYASALGQQLPCGVDVNSAIDPMKQQQADLARGRCASGIELARKAEGAA